MINIPEMSGHVLYSLCKLRFLHSKERNIYIYICLHICYIYCECLCNSIVNGNDARGYVQNVSLGPAFEAGLALVTLGTSLHIFPVDELVIIKSEKLISYLFVYCKIGAS